MKINYKYDSHNKTSICEMIYDNKTFIGTAQCHPDDEDVASERVGAIIAESRAAIKYF